MHSPSKRSKKEIKSNDFISFLERTPSVIFEENVSRYLETISFDCCTEMIGLLLKDYNTPEWYDFFFRWGIQNKQLQVVKLVFGRTSKSNYDDLILMAIIYDDFEALNFLVRRATDIKKVVHRLISVAAKNNLELLKILIEKKVNIKPYEYELLTVSSTHGNIELLKYLVSIGVNVKEAGIGIAGLISASKNGHTEAVKYLVDLGIDPCYSKNTCIAKACENGHYEVVKFLISYLKDIKSPDCYRILNKSVMNEHTRIVKLLLDKGMTPYSRCFYDAISKNNYEIIKLFVEKGAEIHNDIIIRVCEQGHCKTLDFLMTKKYIDEECGRISMIKASKNGHIDVVRLLNEMQGSNGNFFDREEAFKKAVENGHSDIVSLFFDAGELVVDKETLEKASDKGHYETIKLIFKRQKFSPEKELYYSCKHKDYENIKRSLDNGAELNNIKYLLSMTDGNKKIHDLLVKSEVEWKIKNFSSKIPECLRIVEVEGEDFRSRTIDNIRRWEIIKPSVEKFRFFDSIDRDGEKWHNKKIDIWYNHLYLKEDLWNSKLPPVFKKIKQKFKYTSVARCYFGLVKDNKGHVYYVFCRNQTTDKTFDTFDCETEEFKPMTLTPKTSGRYLIEDYSCMNKFGFFIRHYISKKLPERYPVDGW